MTGSPGVLSDAFQCRRWERVGNIVTSRKPLVYVARDADRGVTDLFAISVADGGFANDVLHHFGGAGGLQFGSHAAQGDTQNIPVM